MIAEILFLTFLKFGANKNDTELFIESSKQIIIESEERLFVSSAIKNHNEKKSSITM